MLHQSGRPPIALRGGVGPSSIACNGSGSGIARSAAVQMRYQPTALTLSAYLCVQPRHRARGNGANNRYRYPADINPEDCCSPGGRPTLHPDDTYAACSADRMNNPVPSVSRPFAGAGGQLAVVANVHGLVGCRARPVRRGPGLQGFPGRRRRSSATRLPDHRRSALAFYRTPNARPIDLSTHVTIQPKSNSPP